MARADGAYAALEARFAHVAALGGAVRVLRWDSAVNMPPGGAAARAEQAAALKLARREALAEDGMGRRLEDAAAEVADDPWRAANLREMRRVWIHETAPGPDLVAARTRAEAACELTWRRARAENDFAAVRPLLETVLDHARRTGEAVAAMLGGSVYEALMDRFEPGAATDSVDVLFDQIAAFLPGFLARVLDAQSRLPPPPPMRGTFPAAAQRALGMELMARLGFDFDQGRLDASPHPFCGGVPGDIRVTTRYDPADFSKSLMAVLHETGHALYEAGLPAEWRGQPVGRARGMALHESQSLAVEMQACRSPQFLAFLAGPVRAAFPGAAAWDGEALLRHYHRVRPGPIRVDADEVTYPAHVILRYRLETAMVAGDLAVADLPGAWSEGMEALLGVRPTADSEGCLQDIHWYDGAWGYFPAYLMGAAAAAQLFAAARAADPSIPGALAAGDLGPLVAWLRENVHGKGALPPDTGAALEAATGAGLGAAALEAHLAARYLPA